MNIKVISKKILSLTLVGALMIGGCGVSDDDNEAGNTDTDTTITSFADMDMSKWLYESDADVYYQVGQTYCENPADTTYETLGYFVPGAYFDAKKNDDDTYTCTVNETARAGDYTAATAPIVIPVETPGYMAMSAPDGYTDVSAYTSQGFVYLFAGCRGRDQGAPAGVTDLKAAIRYIRSQGDELPGDKDRIYSFGMSGGGAQSALLGATGDSELYTPYLDAIGAVSDQSDAIAGSMCWCPITSLDTADQAYEWNMSESRDGLSDEEQTISDGLADAYADYINSIKLKDEDGTVLTLDKSSKGHMQSGTYYDYVLGQLEKSFDNFLSDNEFPYDADAANQDEGMGGFGGRQGMDNNDGAFRDANFKDKSDQKDGSDFKDKGDFKGKGGFKKDKDDGEGFSADDNIQRTNQTSGAVSISGSYDTVGDYISALNKAFTWVTYDENTNKVKISAISDFSKAVKPASKSLGAFDQLDRSQGENTLFGYGDGEGAHFDSTLAKLVKGSEYETEFDNDLKKTDSVGSTVEKRINMYSPLYYLLPVNEGYQTSKVAKNWRIRTGAWQSDTSVTTEINLSLALKNYSDDMSVDFDTVWGAKHIKAERTGEASQNFINWVKSI